MGMLLSDQTLFRNEDVFSPNHVPEDVLYRELQIREMVLSAKPAMRGGRAQNCFLVGPPATGKTTCARLVAKEASSNKVFIAYVNCSIYDTTFKIFSEIQRCLFGFAPAETGVPLNVVYDKIFSHLSKEKKALVVILDESDRLFSRQSDVFYKILRAHEVYSNARTSLWSISASDSMHRLDDKVRSIFMPNVIKFGKYSFKETREILKRRCDEGLYKGVVSGKILDNICENAADLRQAIETMRRAVVAAENEALESVEMRHAEKFLVAGHPATEKPVSEDEKILTEALKNPVDSGRLFGSLEGRMSYSKFYRLLKKMESSGTIEVTPASKGKGKTSIISLKK